MTIIKSRGFKEIALHVANGGSKANGSHRVGGIYNRELEGRSFLVVKFFKSTLGNVERIAKKMTSSLSGPSPFQQILAQQKWTPELLELARDLTRHIDKFRKRFDMNWRCVPHEMDAEGNFNFYDFTGQLALKPDIDCARLSNSWHYYHHHFCRCSCRRPQ